MFQSSQAAARKTSSAAPDLVPECGDRYTWMRRSADAAIWALGQVPEWLNGPDCKSGAKATVVRIRPCPPAPIVDIGEATPIRAHIAQLVEHILGKNEVPGSSPGVGSTQGPATRGSHEPLIVLCAALAAFQVGLHRGAS